MLRHVRLIAIALWFVALSTADAEACSCMDPGPPCQAYWTTDVIFRGRVESISRPADRTIDPRQFVTVTFTVLEPFRGVDGATVEVRTPTGPASCALRFSKGREYVVHAARVSGVITTSSCSRTRRVERAAEDLEYARSIASGGAPLGRIGGRITLFNRSLWTRGSYRRPMHDVPVTLRRGDDFAVMVRSDRSGEFAANGLEAGTYSITIEPQGRFRIEAPAAVTLADARGCAVADVALYPEGRVSGRVLDPGGRPIRGLTVDLTAHREADADAPARSSERLRAVTDHDGKYEFLAVPSGGFVVGINTGLGSPGTFVFHPGVMEAEEATSVSMPAGGDVELSDLVIPSSVSFVEISGVILDGDRVAVEGARVYLRGPEERDYILTAPVITDLSGRFTIAALAGHEYVLFAEHPSREARGRVKSTDLVRVIAGPARERLKLTLRSKH